MEALSSTNVSERAPGSAQYREYFTSRGEFLKGKLARVAIAEKPDGARPGVERSSSR